MKPSSLFRLLQTLLFAVCTAMPVAQAGMMDQFKDDDGWFDGSDWVLDNAIGFMPVPIIITEPAVGEGLGIAAAFFHPPKGYSKEEYEALRAKRAAQAAGDASEEPAQDAAVDSPQATAGDEDRGSFVLPDITIVAAAATNNGSWLVGGGHIAHWRKDTIRYQGLVGYASLNLDYYLNIGEQSIPFEFNGEGFLSSQPLAFRIGKSDFFIGGNWDYSKITTKFDKNIPELEFLNFESTESALGLFLQYDSRNTIFTPTKGTYAEISYQRNSEKIGSDWDYDRAEFFVHHYRLFAKKFGVGLRANLIDVNGDLPFYSVPFISLRGIPALRYQGESVGVVEADLAWRFHPRWAATGFVGVGKADESFSDFSDSPSRVAKGVGFRYNTARKLGMWAGIDVAKGPEDTYWYITVGSPWRD